MIVGLGGHLASRVAETGEGDYWRLEFPCWLAGRVSNVVERCGYEGDAAVTDAAVADY